ncbi:hypothetical protein D5366_00170 [Neokomagataea tanensis]|uniref:Uncharacterized protein n=2 Tax=Acetobacteraceae TaxID=433 RepID=A0A4Y6V6I9_9PROT|nr:hypothetical protein D5366_00170 [Neokomagataea tanensis]
MPLLSSILVAAAAPEARAQTLPSFQVHDTKAPEEISETSRLYVDGKLAATFRLNLAHTDETKTIPLPVGRTTMSYALCGEITIIHDGRQETHSVSSAGMLHHPEGRVLEAVGSQHFTEFFLVDYDDAMTATHTPGQAEICAIPNS